MKRNNFTIFILTTLLLMVASTPALALRMDPNQSAADKKAQEEFLKKQRDAYQIYKFEQEQRKEDKKVMIKKDREAWKARQKAKEMAQKALTRQTPTFWEAFLNIFAVGAIVVAVVLFIYGFLTRVKSGKIKDDDKPTEI